MAKSNLAVIPHKVDSFVIEQRALDGYINATALCKAANKLWGHYYSSGPTKDFLEELAASIGIAIDDKYQPLIQSKAGSPENGGGTWVHPQVAIHLAQWASPKFAVQVSKWVYDWLNGKSALPVHLNRYLKNDTKIPSGYFSALQEAGTQLIGKLHVGGFDLPDDWVPDISLGLLFCKYLRNSHGVDTDSFNTYSHDYYNGKKPRPAKLYPNAYLPLFRSWLSDTWFPTHGLSYFSKKDKESGLNSMMYVANLADFKLLKKNVG